ncbi:hypothetical protein KP509_18G037400 [Ceratopteris richardii]|uniref:Uncharacterized protein n=1 Tax=Ceratopteris richardii TaxID=49495 RepID=A0A8T2SNS0_CERRI|nr:hypothetical protein KP509_18G037400 [Ceratopteris richardii]
MKLVVRSCCGQYRARAGSLYFGNRSQVLQMPCLLLCTRGLHKLISLSGYTIAAIARDFVCIAWFKQQNRGFLSKSFWAANDQICGLHGYPLSSVPNPPVLPQ